MHVTMCTEHYHHHRAIIISALPLSVVYDYVKHVLYVTYPVLLYVTIHNVTCHTVCDNT